MSIVPTKSDLYLYPRRIQERLDRRRSRELHGYPTWENASRLRQWLEMGFRDLVEMSTLHCVDDLVYSAGRWFAFSFWMVVLVAMSGITVWQMYLTFYTFYSENAYTTTVSYSSATSMTFPNVTICNYNRAQANQLKSLNMSTSALSYLFWSYYVSYPFGFNFANVQPAVVNATYVQAQADWKAWIAAHPLYANHTDRLATDLAHTCAMTVVSCSFSGQAMGPNSCCEAATNVSNSYGSCFSVNLGSTLVSPGPSFGMQLFLFPHLDQYVDLAWNNYLDEGLVVLVNFDPKHPFPTNPIHVPPGSHALIGIHESYYTFNEPSIEVFSLPCSYNTSLKMINANYSIDNCKIDCYVHYTAKLCNCTILGIETIGTTLPVCMPDLTPCVFQLTQVYHTGFSSQMTRPPGNEKSVIDDYKTCTSNCVASCDDAYEIETTVSVTEYPSTKAMSAIGAVIEEISNDSNAVAHVNDTIVLEIFYPALGYSTYTTAETMPIFTFIGSVGGQIGLWLGASIVTLIQIVYYICVGHGRWLAQRWAQRKMTVRESF